MQVEGWLLVLTKTQVVPVEFTSGGETVRGNLVTPTSEGPFPGICKYHGLPGGPDQVGGIATRLAEVGFAVLTFDFRGFRSSDGFFRLAGEIVDAKNSVTYLLESEFTFNDWIGVYGASYGGAVAICSSAEDKRVQAVCVRAPVFDTYMFALSPMIEPEVKRIIETDPSQIRGIENPETRKLILRRMVEDAIIYNPMKDIPGISPRPLFIITGDADRGIPVEGVRELYDKAGEPKQFAVVEGADHVLSDPAQYEETVTAVIEWFLSQRP
ncbi:MAG: prolyl oligopeptidase family serine peptidase [Candidatus Thorarchaeota archaeon]|nr:MAG: prolyl oligopeptidase family serine peptidase [Candidatus Thorarchaeota archaeon]